MAPGAEFAPHIINVSAYPLVRWERGDFWKGGTLTISTGAERIGNPVHGGWVIVFRKLSIKSLLYAMAGLVLAAFVALAASLVLRWNEELEFARRERIGVAYIPAVQSVSVLLAQHRGLANIWLNGDAGVQARLAALEEDVERAMESVDEKCGRFGPALGPVCGQWAELRAGWSGLKSGYRRMSPADSFAEHTRIVGGLLALETEAADRTNLTLDPMLETYYLTDTMVRSLPLLMESLGQARGLGSGVAARGTIAPTERIELAKLAHMARMSMRSLDWGMGKVFSGSPGFEAGLQDDTLAIADAVERFFGAVDRELVSADAIRIRGEDFFAQATRIMDRVSRLYDPVVVLLEGELATRADRLALQRRLGVGGVIFTLVLMALLLAYVIRRITAPLAHAVACFRQIGQGVYDYPIEVKYQDEFGQVLAAARDMQARLAAYVDRLRAVSGSLAEAQRIACLGSWDWSMARDEMLWSDQVYRIFDRNPNEFAPTYSAFLSAIHPEDQSKVKAAMRKALRERVSCSLDHRIVRPDGATRVVHERAEAMFDRDGRPLRLVGTVQDVTEQREAEIQMRLAAQVMAHSSEAILITDARNNITLVNRAFTEITGYSAAEVLHRNPRLLSSQRQGRGFYEKMWRAILEAGVWKGKIWNRRKNGEIYAEWLSVSTIKDDEGRITHYIGIFADITEHIAAQERIYFLAHYDPLTGLANRALLQDRIKQALIASDRRGRQAAVLFIDLDRFKFINDSFGHAHGDAVLQTVAKRLTQCVREEDTVARLGGDEFVILLSEISDEQVAALTARRVLGSLSQPIFIDGNDFRITSSVGVAVYPRDAEDFDALLSKADAAMYVAKDRGRNGYELFASAFRGRVG